MLPDPDHIHDFINELDCDLDHIHIIGMKDLL